MNCKVIRLLAIILIVCNFFVGCASVTPLSDEDIERVALYSASVVGKFNRSMNRGFTAVKMTPKEEESNAEENGSGATIDNPAGFPSNPDDVNAPESTGDVNELGDLVAIPGTAIRYLKTNISEDFGSDGGFLMSPQPGNSFVAVVFTVSNTTGQDLDCNIQNRSLNFTATLGETTSAVTRTIMPNDFTTYNDTIPAGESVDLTLLFQFPTGLVSDLSGLSLTCIKDGVRSPVVL